MRNLKNYKNFKMTTFKLIAILVICFLSVRCIYLKLQIYIIIAWQETQLLGPSQTQPPHDQTRPPC